MTIFFYHPVFKGLNEREILDLNNDWQFFTTGPKVWIVQTYIKLKLAGYPVKAIGDIPKAGLVVIHSDHFYKFWEQAESTQRMVFICIRADRKENSYADFEVLQNAKFEDKKTKFFIPHWPQPNLIERNPQRGNTVRRIAFKGFLSNLNPILRGEIWQNYLRENNLEWVVDAPVWNGADDDYETNWNDYREVDLLIAIREDIGNCYDNKPASKLINAWRAGVPCILGPEVPYQELRRNDVDYFEASSLDEVIGSINRLLESPRLYRQMVENGLIRSKQYSESKIIQQWADLLLGIQKHVDATPLRRMYYWLPLGKRKFFQRYLKSKHPLT